MKTINEPDLDFIESMNPTKCNSCKCMSKQIKHLEIINKSLLEKLSTVHLSEPIQVSVDPEWLKSELARIEK